MCCIVFGATAEVKLVPKLEDLLSSLEKKHSQTKTLAAKFQQEKYFSFMDKPLVSDGFILFSSPDSIRFDINEPFQESLLFDGKKISRYEYVNRQWRSMEFSGGRAIKLVMEQIGLWMQGKFSQQKDLFNMSVSADDPNGYVVLDMTPIPKQFQQYIQKIRIHVSKPPEYKITRIEIIEPAHDRFALLFVQEIFNRELSKNLFSKPETATQCQELFLSQQAQVPDGSK